MSFSSTQNLNPTYDLLSVTELQASSTITTNNLTLSNPIVSTNTTVPNISDLGYFTTTQNTSQINLISGDGILISQTVADNPIGVYQVNANVRLSLSAGTTLESYTLYFQTESDVIALKTESAPVLYNYAGQTTPIVSVCFFNTVPQQFEMIINAVFSEGTCVVNVNDCKLSIVRIA